MDIRSAAIGIVAGLLVVAVLPAGAQEQARVDPAWVLEDHDKRVVYSVSATHHGQPGQSVYRQ